MNYQQGSAAWLIGLIVVILVGFGLYAFTRPNNDQETKTAVNQALEQSANGNNMMGEEEKTNETDDMMMEGEGGVVLVDKNGTYEAYAPEKLVLANSSKVVLFFHAAWCPICRAIEKEVDASPTSIPDGVHILKVDYDTATDLRQKYGVTVQHTFVQVDAQGEPLAKWSDSTDLADALSRIL